MFRTFLDFLKINDRQRILFIQVLSFMFVGLFASNFNIGHNFCTIKDSNLIFGVHVYLMELDILSGERPRSSFNVKGQIYRGHSVSQKILYFLLKTAIGVVNHQFLATSYHFITFCICQS